MKELETAIKGKIRLLLLLVYADLGQVVGGSKCKRLLKVGVVRKEVNWARN